MTHQLIRRGAPIALAEHRCGYRGCEGTIWRHSHVTSTATGTTGRSVPDVVDGREVQVMVTFDQTQDSHPICLLQIGDPEDTVDVDVSPTAAEARRIAIDLLKAADAPDEWRRVHSG
jgi:hypothetical protein